MSQATGWAVIPASLSFSGVNQQLSKEIIAPAAKAAKQAGDSISKGIGDGATAAAKNVEKANFRVKKSTEELTTAEGKLVDAKSKSEQAVRSVESAELARAQAVGKANDKLEKAEQDYQRVLDSGSATADEVAAAEKRVEDARQSSAKVGLDQANRVQKAYDGQRKAAQDVEKAQGGVEKAMSESSRAAKSLADRQQELETAQADAGDESQTLGKRIREMGEDADDAGGMFDGMVGKIGGIAGALAGVAGAGAFAGLGKELSGEIAQINRELGYTGAAAEGVEDAVGEALRSGVASSAEEAAGAIGALEGQFKYLGSEGEQTAGQLSDNFLAVARTFDVDLAESTQVAGQLIQNGLAPDVESAADLMTTALQRVPEAMRGETLDAINEYGTNFSNLGFSGEEAFSLIVGASEQGQYAIDKTGDSIKEFSVLAIDPAKAEAFEALGMNAEDAATSVAEGGEGARKTLEETAQALLDMEDPGQRAATAVELFGAPIEDLGVDKIPAFLENLTGMENGMAGAEGASQELADTMANSLGGRMDALKGTVQALAGDAFMWLWDVIQNDIIPAFQNTVKWVQENEKWLAPLALAIGSITAGLVAFNIQQTIAAAGGLAGMFAKLAGAVKGATAVQWLFNASMWASPITWIVAGIAALVAGLVYFFTQTEVGQRAWESFTGALADGWDWVTEKIGAGIDWIQEKFGKFTDWISTAWSGITDLFSGDYTGAISDAFGIEEDSAIIGFFFGVRDAFTGLRDLIVNGDFGEALRNVFGWEEDHPMVQGILTIRDVAINTFDTIKENVKIAVDVIKDVFGGLWALVTGDMDGLKEHARSALDGVTQIFSNAWSTIRENASLVFTRIWDSLGISTDGVLGSTLSTVWDVFSSTFETVKQNLVDWAGGTWSAIKGVFSFVTGDFDGMKEHFGDAFGSVKDIASRTWQTVKDNASKIWDNFTFSAPKIWDGIKDQAGNAWDGITSTVSEKAGDMWSGIKDGARGAFDWASDNEITGPAVGAITKIGDGIGNQWGEFQEKVQPLKDSVSDLWGTLTGDGEDLAEGEERGGIAGFIDTFSGQVSDLQEKFQPVKDAATDLWDVLTGKASEASGDAQEGIAGMIGTFTENVADLQEKMQPAKDAIKSVWNALTGKDDEGNLMSEEGDEQGGLAGMVQKITDKITDFRDAAQPVIDKFKEKWDELSAAMAPKLESLQETIGDVAKKIGGATLVIAIGLLLSPFIILAGVVYGAVVALNAIADAFAWVSEKWTEMKGGLQEGWDSLKENVFDAFERGVQSISDKFTEVKDWITLKWDQLVAALETGWNWIDQNVIIPFLDGLQGLWDKVLEVVDWIKGKWDDMVAGLERGWNWISDNVFDPMGRGLDTVKGWFQDAVDGIGRIWDGLKEAAAKPVRFVVDTVWNNGLLKAVNAVTGFIGMDPVDPVKINFATGGVLPGYTPGRDPYTFVEPSSGMRIGLSGGEAILRPEATRALGTGWVNSVNAAAISGGQSGVENQLMRSHFADGGVLDLGNFNMGGITNLAGGLSDIQQSHARFVGRFFPDLFSLTSAMRFTDSGHHSTGKATDWQAKDGQFASQMPTPGSKALARAIFTNFPNSAELIHHPLDGWQNLSEGAPYDFGPGTNADHGNHVHWATHSPLQFNGDDIVLTDVPGGGGGGNFIKGIWDRIVNAINPYEDDDGGWFGQVPGNFLKSAVDKVWSFIAEKAKSVFNFFTGGSGGGAEQWRDLSRVALGRHGYGDEHLDAMVRQIEIESGGNPNAVNLWDSNARRGTPSGGLIQVIRPTYDRVRAAYPDAFEGLPNDHMEPLSNLTAGVGAVKLDWGGPANRWPTVDGYHLGGLAPAGQGILAKTALEPEMVLNPKMTDAFIDWMRGTPQGESAAVVAKELSSAFAGEDWGYGELAHVLGNEEWARAVIQGAATLGVISRDTDFIAANAEMHETAQSAGRSYLETQAASILDVVGLGGLVTAGSSLWDSHGEEALSQAHSTAQSLYGATQNTDTTATASFMGQRVTLEFNAESLDEVVRIGDLKAQADRIDGLEVKMNAKRKPPAAHATRGGPM